LFVQGELEHHWVKQFYPHVQKNQYIQGIAKQQHRERVLHQMLGNGPRPTLQKKRKYRLKRAVVEYEPLSPGSPDQHHQISADVRNKIDVSRWLGDNLDDPALKVYGSP